MSIEKPTIDAIIQVVKNSKLKIYSVDKETNEPILDIGVLFENATKYQNTMEELEEWLKEMNDIVWGSNTTSYSILRKLQKLKKEHGLPFDERIVNG